MHIRRVALASLAFALALPAGAGMLYKSVGADGSIMFSDVPPPATSRLVEQRVIGAGGTIVSDAASGAARTMQALENLFESDPSLAQANSQVDMAEHALALARREVWSPREGLRLRPTAKTIADDLRIEFFKRNVTAARQALMDLLRERRLAQKP